MTWNPLFSPQHLGILISYTMPQPEQASQETACSLFKDAFSLLPQNTAINVWCLWGQGFFLPEEGFHFIITNRRPCEMLFLIKEQSLPKG